jgi:hypothetical protein
MSTTNEVPQATRDWLLILSTGSAGCIDAAIFLKSQVFTANMSARDKTNLARKNRAEFSGVAGGFRYTACSAHKSLRICEHCRLGKSHLLAGPSGGDLPSLYADRT